MDKQYFENLVQELLSPNGVERLRKIGEGYSRTAFEIIGTKYVLKVSKTAFGVAQSKVEYDAYSENIFEGRQVPIFYSDENHEVMIVALAKPRHLDRDSCDCEGTLGDFIKDEDREELARILQNACDGEYEFQSRDLLKSSSWGEYNGKDVLIDAGWAERTCKIRDEIADKFNCNNWGNDYKHKELEKYENLRQRYSIHKQKQHIRRTLK